MKHIFLFILVLTCFNCAKAQQSADSLLLHLKNAKNDSNRTEIYKNLFIYYAYTNWDSVQWYADEAIKYATSRNDELMKATFLGQLSVLDVNTGRVDEGKQLTQDALEIFRRHHRLKGVAENLSNLGTIAGLRGNFDSAVYYLIEAMRLYDSVTDNNSQLQTCVNIAKIYMEHGDSLNSYRYLVKAEKLADHMEDCNNKVFLYNIVGVYYAEHYRPDTALMYFMKSLDISRKPGMEESRTECLLYLSDYFLSASDTVKAKGYLKEGLDIANKYNIVEMEANFLMDLAEIAEKTDADLAIGYLNKARDICLKMKDKNFVVNVYNEQINAYKHKGDYRNALGAMEERQKIMDSLFNLKNTTELTKIEKAYELEKNEKIRQLTDLNWKNTTKRNALIVVAIVLIVILIILALFYRNSITLNRRLAAREKELGELNAMKDKLFSIIGHDLRSPLTQIPAILTIYDDPDTTEEDKRFMFEGLKEHSHASLETLDKLLMWGKSLVKGVDWSPIKMNTKKTIKQNIELKKTAALDKKITVTDNTLADLDIFCDATHFDFIIRNLLANAIKYTRQGGKVEINANKDDAEGIIVFEVKDNGVGMDAQTVENIFRPLTSQAGTANEKGTGIGLMLCKEFVIRNGGSIWVQSEPGKGATFYFTVKTA